MNIDEVLRAVTPEVYERFKTAIELGRWPDGRRLTKTQMETCLQAIIAYEHHNLNELKKTGYVPPKTTPCRNHQEHDDSSSEQPIYWQH